MMPQTLCSDIAPYLGVHSNTETLLHSSSERRLLMDKTAFVNRTIIEAPLRHVLNNPFYWVEDSADVVNKPKYDHDINDCVTPNIEARMTRVWSWLRNPLSDELSPCDLYLLESYNSTPSPSHRIPSTCHEAVCSHPQVDNSPGSPASPTGRPDGSSSIDETGDAVTTTDQQESAVDETLTLLKLEELRQYVKHLEASIRSNESARKELNDWLFEQMTGITISPGDSSTSEGEIKRVFEDRSKTLKQHAKTLNDQLQATQFVVQTLESHGIPRDVSPKSYVRELLKRRGKGAAPGFPPSPRSPPARESNEPTESQHPPTRERSSHTLPALPTTSSRTPDLSEARRHAQTLPSERTCSQELSSTRRISDPDPLAPLFRPSPLLSAAARLKPTGSLASLSHYGKPSLDPQTNPDKPHFVPASNVCLPAPRTLPFSSHPTSPELFSIAYADDSVEAGSKPLRVSLPLSEHKPETSGAGGGVLHTVRHGLEIFGRQFRRPRSASEENVIAATKAAGYSRLAKQSNRPRSRTAWMGPLSRRSKKPSSPTRNSLDPSVHTNLVDNHGLIPVETPNRSRISHSGSVCSASALPVATNNPFINTLNMPNLIDRSMSAYSGSTPLKEELLSPPAVGPSVGSTSGLVPPTAAEYGDNALTKIFELLSITMPSCQNQGAGIATRASSGSSASIPGPSVSNGPKSAPTGAVAPGVSAHAEALGASTGLLNSALLSTPYSHNPIPTGNVALALTAFYRMWTMQLSSLTAQQTEGFQSLRNELASIRREHLQLHETAVKLTAELGSISRDAQTREELHKQKLSDATTRIEKLDATAEESRQAMQRELVLLRNEFRDTWAKLEYQLTTKTRDLNDSITTISNRVTIIEKPSEQHGGAVANGSELSRIRHKVLHYLTDMCVSLFALLTMLLQVLIRCLNLGAVVTENRQKFEPMKLHLEISTLTPE
ncbi:hypothetical protein CRM22_001098 [Opisthorchis felineus]|uniref:Uncharacterized protein n=1 Tax=Opisthorchis felineus TaxID=147828 RepID=A0A4S2MCB9_OPIFE|nr:hypothetical protein CRM22_001098 [Opisthorchis felineus]